MIGITLTFHNESKKYLEALPGRISSGTSKSLLQAIRFAETKSKQIFKEGGKVKSNVLTSRTGHLRRSIQSGISGLTAWIGTDVKYGKVHEYGGTIRANKSKYLKFKVNGHWVSTKSVTIPKRPFLSPAIEDNIEEIKNIILGGIVESANG